MGVPHILIPLRYFIHLSTSHKNGKMGGMVDPIAVVTLYHGEAHFQTHTQISLAKEYSPESSNRWKIPTQMGFSPCQVWLPEVSMRCINLQCFIPIPYTCIYLIHPCHQLVIYLCVGCIYIYISWLILMIQHALYWVIWYMIWISIWCLYVSKWEWSRMIKSLWHLSRG